MPSLDNGPLDRRAEEVKTQDAGYIGWNNAFSFGQLCHRQVFVDALMERILFLEGLPWMQELGKLYIGQKVAEMLECDLKLEMEAIPVLREAIVHSEKVGDFVSRHLFREILSSEEEHVDWIETQLDLIGKTGIENYLQSQM